MDILVTGESLQFEHVIFFFLFIFNVQSDGLHSTFFFSQYSMILVHSHFPPSFFVPSPSSCSWFLIPIGPPSVFLSFKCVHVQHTESVCTCYMKNQFFCCAEACSCHIIHVSILRIFSQVLESFLECPLYLESFPHVFLKHFQNFRSYFKVIDPLSMTIW